MTSQPVPQRTVRLAWAADVPAIAEIQLGALRATMPAEVAGELAVEDLAAAWRAAVTRPPTARHRVLVATEGIGAADTGAAGAAVGGPAVIAAPDLGTAGGAPVVGFAATGPADDPDATAGEDGEVIALHTARPDDGLASALLAAAADTLEADGFTRGQLWVSATDDALRRVADEAGWTPDGAYRQLDLGNGDGAAGDDAAGGGRDDAAGGGRDDAAGGGRDGGAGGGRDRGALTQVRVHTGLADDDHEPAFS